MKRLVESKETDGLDNLMGEYVELYCMNYIYCGKLMGVGVDDVCLAECKIVYETGGLLDHSSYERAESFGTDERFVCKRGIESYGLAPKLVA